MDDFIRQPFAERVLLCLPFSTTTGSTVGGQTLDRDCIGRVFEEGAGKKEGGVLAWHGLACWRVVVILVGLVPGGCGV